MSSKNEFSLEYPDNEKPIRERIDNLMRDWKTSLEDQAKPEENAGEVDFVNDGFYLHYFDQKLRILFIGRESRYLSGCDYISVMLEAFQISKSVGKQSLNSNKFNSRILHITWGILNDFSEWGKIPWAKEIGDMFGTKDGCSCAFMNISKSSNDNLDSWTAQHEIIRNSIANSSSGKELRNFIVEEIEILEPHLIVTMNLDGHLNALGELQNEVREKDVERYKLKSGKHESVLINAWHFAAPNKNQITEIYQPICNAIQNAVADGWIEEFPPDMTKLGTGLV